MHGLQSLTKVLGTPRSPIQCLGVFNVVLVCDSCNIELGSGDARCTNSFVSDCSLLDIIDHVLNLIKIILLSCDNKNIKWSAHHFRNTIKYTL